MGAEDAPHPLVGGFAPDLALVAADGTRTGVAELMRQARPVLLDLDGRADLIRVAEGWAGRVDAVSARCEQRGAGASALLIRPDGYIAWAAPGNGGRGRDCDGLLRALTSWFGAAR